MRSVFFIKKILCAVLITASAFFCGLTAFAVDGDGDTLQQNELVTEEPYYEPETEPVTDEPYYEPETEPVTDEPYYEPETEPVTDEPYYEPVETEPYYEIETETYTQAAYAAADEEATTEFQAPTLAKTVSTKTYSTNYTAGIVSWICVAVGTLVIAVVLISTKASGRT